MDHIINDEDWEILQKAKLLHEKFVSCASNRWSKWKETLTQEQISAEMSRRKRLGLERKRTIKEITA